MYIYIYTYIYICVCINKMYIHNMCVNIYAYMRIYLYLQTQFRHNGHSIIVIVHAFTHTSATLCSTLQHTTAHCNTLQQTATHCTASIVPICVLLRSVMAHVAKSYSSAAKGSPYTWVTKYTCVAGLPSFFSQHMYTLCM